MNKYFLLIIGAFLIILLLGCDLPDCNRDTIIKPDLISPTGGITITDPSPDLTWEFNSLCKVAGYSVTVGTWVPPLSFRVFHDDFAGTVTTATSDIDYLQDCTTYYWQVETWSASTYDETSTVEIFKTDFTGDCPPVDDCGGNAPAKPFIMLPAGSVEVANPQILWAPRNYVCQVDGYHYEVADSALFTNILLEGDTTATSVEPITDYLPNDCQYYFSRVSAEAFGKSTTSDIGIFATAFTGACWFRGCFGSELVPAVLVQPEENEVVNRSNPQFVWHYDTDECTPDFEIYVSEFEDLSHGLFHTTTWGSTAWQPERDSLRDCTKYYWAVYVTDEGRHTVVPSDTGSFTTNFFGVCPIELNTHLPDFLELIQIHIPFFRLGCVSSDQMWATFEFDGPIEGNFEARLGNLQWACELMQGSDNKLLCYGRLATQGVAAEVILFDLDNNQKLLTLQGTTPYCAQAQVCQPPGEGCSPVIIGYQNNLPIFAPTYWDSTLCKCMRK